MGQGVCERVRGQGKEEWSGAEWDGDGMVGQKQKPRRLASVCIAAVMMSMATTARLAGVGRRPALLLVGWTCE